MGMGESAAGQAGDLRVLRNAISRSLQVMLEMFLVEWYTITRMLTEEVIERILSVPVSAKLYSFTVKL